ncbi:hypothetical protein H5410_026122 [Solanum commersonii]|uniref:Uncharacterized protein n=1 Tax=Solanum commersonii TaxID=4109 RepID=A0A9J5Z0J9_SOLCO|nr:hypothetical protein H5410_026122 [Solanum commersonii]
MGGPIFGKQTISANQATTEKAKANLKEKVETIKANSNKTNLKEGEKEDIAQKLKWRKKQNKNQLNKLKNREQRSSSSSCSLVNNSTVPNPSNSSKNKPIPEPAPFTIVNSYSTRLGANQQKNEVPIELSTPQFTIKQGLPAVIKKGKFHDQIG